MKGATQQKKDECQVKSFAMVCSDKDRHFVGTRLDEACRFE